MRGEGEGLARETSLSRCLVHHSLHRYKDEGLLLASLCLLALLFPWEGASSATPVTACAPNSTDIARLLATNTTITLERGNYCVSEYVLVANKRGFRLAGTAGGPSDTIIQCSEGAGLAFLNVTQLTLSNVSILNCGVTGSNLSDFVRLVNESVDMFYTVPDGSSAAVLIAASTDVTLLDVTIRESRGYGLIAINLYGEVNVIGAVFDRNRPTMSAAGDVPVEVLLQGAGVLLGGGAIFMYFDLVGGAVPGEAPMLVVRNSYFDNNTVYYASELRLSSYLFSASVREKGFTLGSGGGLSLKLCQSTYAVVIDVQGTTFTHSDAVVGAGAHIVWYEHTLSSNVTFSGCTFENNGHIVSENTETYGGGVSIQGNLYHPDYQISAANSLTILFDSCQFLSNRAKTGGAVHAREPFSRLAASTPNYITFRDCIFSGNEAAFGCAVSVSSEEAYGVLPANIFEFDNCVLNESVSAFFVNLSSLALGGAAIYSVNGVIMLRDSNITHTEGAGLVAIDSRIDIVGDVYITHNSASFGGGMALHGFSFIVMNDNSNLTFAFNTASRIGGGILYVPPRRMPFLTVQYDCFLLFQGHDPFCNDCTFLGRNISINFHGNRAQLGSMIFGSLLNTCPWSLNLTQPYGAGGRNGKDNIIEFLFEEFPENFNNDTAPRSRGVNTLTSDLSIDSLGHTSVSVMPGQIFVLNGTSADGLDQVVGDIITASVLNNTFDGDEIRFEAVLMDANLWLVLNNSQSTARVMGPEDTNLTLSLRSTNSLARTLLNVILTNCMDGFVFKASETAGECKCSSHFSTANQNNVICSSTYGNISVAEGFWFGSINGNSQLGTDGGSYLVTVCFSPNCNVRGGRTIINTSNLDEQCTFGRSGVLCGGCRPGYSINLGTFECKSCPGYNGIGLILFFVIVGVALVALISLLDINVSNGWLNGMILYANIFVIFREDLLTRGEFPAYFFFSWLSLQWGIPSCFFDGLRPIQSTGLEFVFPMYLWVLVVTIVVVFALCPLKEKWQSLVKNPPKVLATILLLSFTSIMGTSIRVLGAVRFITFSGVLHFRWRVDANVPYFRSAEHAILGLFSMAMIVFLVACTLILLIPQNLACGNHRAKCCRCWVVWQHRMKPILDSFYGPFKETLYVLRSWEGWRFVFRIVLYLIANFASTVYRLWLALFVLILFIFLQSMLAPYKKVAQNWVDSLFLLNMLLLIYLRIADLAYSAQSDDRTLFAVLYHTLLASALLASLAVTAHSCYPAAKRLCLLSRKKFSECRSKSKGEAANDDYAEVKDNNLQLGVTSVQNEMADLSEAHTTIDIPKGPARESFIFLDSEETHTKL